MRGWLHRVAAWATVLMAAFPANAMNFECWPEDIDWTCGGACNDGSQRACGACNHGFQRAYRVDLAEGTVELYFPSPYMYGVFSLEEGTAILEFEPSDGVLGLIVKLDWESGDYHSIDSNGNIEQGQCLF